MTLCSSRYFSEVFSSWWSQKPAVQLNTHLVSLRVSLCLSFHICPPPLSTLKIKQISVHQETSLALLVLRPFFPKITFIKGSKVGSHSGSVDPSVLLFPRRISRENILGRDFLGWKGGMGVTWVDGWGGGYMCVFFLDAFERYTPPKSLAWQWKPNPLGRCISHEKLGDFPASHVDLVGGWTNPFETY